jgi:general secretion pathway protein D
MRQVTAVVRLFGALLIGAALGGIANAAESASTSEARISNPTGGYATVDLAELLDDVGRKANKPFLVDARVPSRVVVGAADVKRVTYPMLLTILKNNACAAVPAQGGVNIIPTAGVRTYPLPIVNKDDSSIADDEWVSRVIRVKQAEAAQMVPILRPLLPQEAHLAAMAPSNSLLMVDRYANVKRVTEIVQQLDVAPTRAQQQQQ